MPSAYQAASALRKWAISKNLVSPLPGNLESQFLAEVASAVMPDTAESLLRVRGIQTIAYNNTDSTVTIYTQRRLTAKEVSQLPQEVAGCSLHFTQGATESLGHPPDKAQAAPYAVITTAGGKQYYACGSSVSPGNSASAGTMGALLSKNGILFGLTNNHVTGGCSHSQIGLPVVAPGVLDVAAGGVPPFTIGFHEEVLDMSHGTQGNVNIMDNTDAAIFKVADPSFVSSMQGDVYDTPTTLGVLADGMEVEKVGRTTRHTKGIVVGRELVPIRIHVTAPEHHFQAMIWFNNVFIVHGLNDPFSDGGDSGSLVTAAKPDGSREAVGLLFAGGGDSKAPGGTRTLVLPLEPILQRLGATLVGGHNVT